VFDIFNLIFSSIALIVSNWGLFRRFSTIKKKIRRGYSIKQNQFRSTIRNSYQMSQNKDNREDMYSELYSHILEQTHLANKNQRNSYWLNVLLAVHTFVSFIFLGLQYAHFEQKVSTGNEVMQFYKEGIYEINLTNRKINYMIELNTMQYNLIYDFMIKTPNMDSIYKEKHFYISKEIEENRKDFEKLLRYHKKLDSFKFKLYEKNH